MSVRAKKGGLFIPLSFHGQCDERASEMKRRILHLALLFNIRCLSLGQGSWSIARPPSDYGSQSINTVSLP